MTNERKADREQSRFDRSQPEAAPRDDHTGRAADGPHGRDQRSEEPSPWLREGADAPDAADIAEPEEQR